MSNRKQVTIFTDGACSGNPGPGGWAAILRCGDTEKEICGGEKETTNNRMELTAVIEGLSALKYPCDVTICTDSKYFADAVTKKWVYAWRAKGWKRAGGQPVLNIDLWEKILALLSIHHVQITWIKGHAGHKENERCDQLAVMQAKQFS